MAAAAMSDFALHFLGEGQKTNTASATSPALHCKQKQHLIFLQLPQIM